MRGILFRGKRLDNGEWIEGFYGIKDENKHCIMVNTIPSGLWAECYFTDHPVDPDTVGQYTGLKDRNGKRIFEGDICRNIKTNEIVSVKWHGTMAGYVWSKRKESNQHLFDFGELFRAYDKYEVIGNIHDQPAGGHEDDHDG